MSIDEILRTIMYVLLIPGLAYLGVRVWNAVVMPEMLRKPVAAILWLQAAIYTLFMVGLILLRLSNVIPGLVWINTVFIILQALLVLRVLWSIWKRQIHLLLVAVLTVLIFLNLGRDS